MCVFTPRPGKKGKTLRRSDRVRFYCTHQFTSPPPSSLSEEKRCEQKILYDGQPDSASERGGWGLAFFFRVLAWKVCPYGGLEVLAVSPKGKSRDIQRRGGGGRQRRQPVADEAFRVSRPKEADNSLGVFLARSSCRGYIYV